MSDCYSHRLIPQDPTHLQHHMTYAMQLQNPGGRCRHPHYASTESWWSLSTPHYATTESWQTLLTPHYTTTESWQTLSTPHYATTESWRTLSTLRNYRILVDSDIL